MSAPRWICGLLRWLTPRDQVDDVLGDLQEAHGRRVARRGRFVAAVVTTLDGLEMAFALVRGRLRIPHPGMSWLDFKLGLRMLFRYPGLTIVAGVALAFAIAVGAVTFEIVNQIMQRTLPVNGGDRIVGLRLWDAGTRADIAPTSADLAGWRAELGSVEHIGAFRTVGRNLITADGGSESAVIAEISAAAFRVMSVPALLGRTLQESDEAIGAPGVAVVGHEVWVTRFGASAGAIGETVKLGDTPVTIIGVMPDGFAFPIAHDVWVPLQLDSSDQQRRAERVHMAFARLAPGRTLEEAQAELAAVGARRAQDVPATYAHVRPEVLPYAQSISDLPALASAVLYSSNLGAVMFLVLISANVALLVFARTATRESELALRSALGASRGRIVMQLFVEALVLGGVSAIVGLRVAQLAMVWTFEFAEASLGPGRLPFWLHAGLSPLTAIYAAALAVLVAVLAGVGPALKVTRGAYLQLKTASAGGSHVRFGGIWTGVIVIQVALTVIGVPLVFEVGRDAAAIRARDPGFPAAEYLSVQLDLDRESLAGLPEPEQAGRRSRFQASSRDLTRRLAAEPGVRAVTFGDPLPGSYGRRRRIEVAGPTTTARTSRGHWPQVVFVQPGFFDVFGAAVLAGRGFDAADAAAGTQVAVVNRSFVDEILGGGGAVGRRVRYRNGADPDAMDPAGDTPGPWFEIVGVVADLALTPDIRERAGLYHPMPTDQMMPRRLAVHLSEAPLAFAPRLRAIAAAVDPDLRVSDVATLDRVIEAQLRFYERWFHFAVVVTGILLLLSLSGIYAVVSFTVSRRTREVGIRVALGADHRRIVRTLLSRSLRQVGLGIAVGTAVLTTVAVLARESPGAPELWVMGLVAGNAMLITAVSLLACAVPIRRALRIQPTEALRSGD